MRYFRVEVPCTLMVTVEAFDETTAIEEAKRITGEEYQSGLDLYDNNLGVLGSAAARASVYFDKDPDIEIEEQTPPQETP